MPYCRCSSKSSQGRNGEWGQLHRVRLQGGVRILQGQSPAQGRRPDLRRRPLKIGQILSCRENLFLDEWISGMEKLQDRVPTKSGEVAWELACEACPGDKSGFHQRFIEIAIRFANDEGNYNRRLRTSGVIWSYAKGFRHSIGLSYCVCDADSVSAWYNDTMTRTLFVVVFGNMWEKEASSSVAPLVGEAVYLCTRTEEQRRLVQI